MRIAIVVFPGTNCEEETHYVLSDLFGQQVDRIWHQDTDLTRYDCVILPGGFSYGDHLRAGAIARFSPVMKSVERLAAHDRLVLGICNGFQILAEAGLLPGTLLPNVGRSFLSTWVNCRVESGDTPFTADIPPGTVLRMPIAHGEGRFFADDRTVAHIKEKGQVVLRYCEPDGALSDGANPNGSSGAIAGVCNEGGNVFGLMPHPERAADDELPSQDGRLIFASMLARAGLNALLHPVPNQEVIGHASAVGAPAQGVPA
jgi:phosphoribosylformylglycinamidine synthase subunit PurQ / glutaminase